MLEREAEAAHRRVADALEGARNLLHGAIVERYGKQWQITSLRAHRGVVGAYGARYYGPGKEIGKRSYDLSTFRGCKVLKYPSEGDAISSPAQTPST